jgi:hypothetical protein
MIAESLGKDRGKISRKDQRMIAETLGRDRKNIVKRWTMRRRGRDRGSIEKRL